MPFIDIAQNPSAWLALADAAIKTTVLLACAALVSMALRRASAASRHVVWTTALLSALALPVLSLAVPRWHLPLVTVAAPVTPDSTSIEAADELALQVSAQMQERLGSQPATASDRQSSGVPSAFLDGVSWSAVLVSIWAIGAVLLLARLAVGILAVWWMSRRTRIVTDAPWLRLARDIAAQLGLSRVTFRRSDRQAMPMAWGIWRRSVLMPAEADRWPQDRLRIVLLHELAHVRRADCLTHMLAQAACAVYWMNPLSWMAARRLRMERERACDDLVLACGTAGPDYADQLLSIARAMRSDRLSAVMAGASLAMARRSQLEGRLMSILDPSVPRTGVSRVRTIIAAAVALLAIVPLASLQTFAHASDAMVPPFPSKQAPPAPSQAPAKVKVSQQHKIEQMGVSQGVAEGVVEGAVQGALQGVVGGAVQGIVQGVTQGAVQGAVQGGLAGGLQWMPHLGDALEGALGQTPNPNPNPMPNPNPGEHDEHQAKADPKVVAALTAALKDSDKEVRESAMQALVRMRDPGIFEPLVAALKDESPDVREQAAFGLGQLRDKRAVAPLAAALKDSAAGVREQAIFALGQLRDPSSIDGITAALRDESADVREQAAFALGQIRDERAVQPLTSLLKDPSASVREKAVFALGQLRARSAVDPLIGATKDENPEVREQAAFALGQIRDPRAIDALTAALKDANAEVRQQAAFALGRLAR